MSDASERVSLRIVPDDLFAASMAAKECIVFDNLLKSLAREGVLEVSLPFQIQELRRELEDYRADHGDTRHWHPTPVDEDGHVRWSILGLVDAKDRARHQVERLRAEFAQPSPVSIGGVSGVSAHVVAWKLAWKTADRITQALAAGEEEPHFISLNAETLLLWWQPRTALAIRQSLAQAPEYDAEAFMEQIDCERFQTVRRLGLAIRETVPPPDGPAPPNLLYWGGNGVPHELPPIPWRMLQFMWGKESAPIEQVEAHVWGHDATDDAIKSALYDLNRRLAEIDVPLTYGRAGAYICKK
jgi:hypothetical protein